MSLGVVIKGAEGIVLAADSRVTLAARREGQEPIPVNFDNATKLLSFSEPHNYIGAVTYGAAVIGLRTPHSFIPELEVKLEGKDRLSVEAFAAAMSEFFLRQWAQVMPDDYDGPPLTFIVGGYDEGAAYGRVFLLNIPYSPDPEEQHPGDKNFGMTWGGQLQVASRIINGYDPALPHILQSELDLDEERIGELLSKLRRKLEFSIPYQVLPLQDCVDLATFMVHTTMKAQNLAVGVRGVGGPIDVAIITRTSGLQYVQRKSIRVN
jgi:hypothetical protein